VLGLGAGTAWRVIEGTLPPDTRLVAEGVEIDPVVVELGREHMDLPPDSPERRTLAGWDARAALRQLPLETYDEIVLDTYANQTEIPAHLSTLELFTEVRERLAMGGWLVANVGGFGLDDPVVEAMARTAAAAFAPDRVLALRVPFSRNCILVARRGDDPPEPGSAAWQVAHEGLAGLLAPMALEGAWRWFPCGAGALLTDDRNPIEAIQRRSIERASEDVGP
jgi:spermidine synthase